MRQLDLADKIGVDKSQVSRWEAGSHQPEKDNLLSLAEALEVAPSWLAGYGPRDPIMDARPPSADQSPILAAALLNWDAAAQVAKLLIPCPEAGALDEAQLASTLKRLYIVAVRDPSKITPDFVAGMALSHS